MTHSDVRMPLTGVDDFDIVAFLFEKMAAPPWGADVGWRFAEALARILVNESRFQAHLLALKARQNEFCRCRKPLTAMQQKTVISNGLGLLDHVTLAALALDPEALAFVNHAINEEVPVAWANEIAKDGKALMEQFGLTALPFKELLKKAKALPAEN
jgi:hypothetical protein